MDSNANGDLYVNKCQEGNQNQQWQESRVSASFLFTNVATKRVLDGNVTGGKPYTFAGHDRQDIDITFHLWQLSFAGKDKSSPHYLMSKQTKQLLVATSSDWERITKTYDELRATACVFQRENYFLESPGIYSILSGELALDSNAAGELYLTKYDDGNRYQLWELQVEAGGFAIRNVAWNRFLDVGMPDDLPYTHADHENKQNYQIWEKYCSDKKKYCGFF